MMPPIRDFSAASLPLLKSATALGFAAIAAWAADWIPPVCASVRGALCFATCGDGRARAGVGDLRETLLLDDVARRTAALDDVGEDFLRAGPGQLPGVDQAD